MTDPETNAIVCTGLMGSLDISTTVCLTIKSLVLAPQWSITVFCFKEKNYLNVFFKCAVHRAKFDLVKLVLVLFLYILRPRASVNISKYAFFGHV